MIETIYIKIIYQVIFFLVHSFIGYDERLFEKMQTENVHIIKQILNVNCLGAFET